MFNVLWIYTCWSPFEVNGKFILKYIPSLLPETNIAPENGGPWKRRFLLETMIFRGYVCFGEGNYSVFWLDQPWQLFFRQKRSANFWIGRSNLEGVQQGDITWDITALILLMDKILHQLISSFSIIYKVLYIPGGAEFLPSTVATNPEKKKKLFLQL